MERLSPIEAGNILLPGAQRHFFAIERARQDQSDRPRAKVTEFDIRHGLNVDAPAKPIKLKCLVFDGCGELQMKGTRESKYYLFGIAVRMSATVCDDIVDHVNAINLKGNRAAAFNRRKRTARIDDGRKVYPARIVQIAHGTEHQISLLI